MDLEIARGLAHDDHEAPRQRDTGSLVSRRHVTAESEALALLTREAGESFELHMLRIAHAPGPAGDAARAIALADIDDLLARTADDPLRWELPAYAWARRHLGGSNRDARIPS